MKKLLFSLIIISYFLLILGLNKNCTDDNQNLKYLDTKITANFRGIDWKPDCSYALIVGDGIFRYDGESFKIISKELKGNVVSWKPDGSYALIAGDEGNIVIYDGTNFSHLSNPYPTKFTDISWKPDGSYALIVGYNGVILKYNGKEFEDISLNGGYFLEGVGFKPDGSYALIVGILNFATLEVFSYDGVTLRKLFEGEAVWPGEVSFDKYGKFALISEDWGHVLKYDEVQFEDLDTGVWQETDGLTGIDFSPVSNHALIVGAWAHSPLNPWHTVLLYKDGTFTTLLNEEKNSALTDVSWRNDGKYAIIVGEKGNALKYTP